MLNIKIITTEGSVENYEKEKHLSTITKAVLLESLDRKNKILICNTKEYSNDEYQEFIKKELPMLELYDSNKYNILAKVSFGNSTITELNSKEGISPMFLGLLIETLDIE